MKICPTCNGKKEVFGIGCPGFKPIVMDCNTCDGKGKITEQQVERMKDGEKLRQERLGRRMTLRAEANRLGMDVVKLSDIEHGKIKNENVFWVDDFEGKA